MAASRALTKPSNGSIRPTNKSTWTRSPTRSTPITPSNHAASRTTAIFRSLPPAHCSPVRGDRCWTAAKNGVRDRVASRSRSTQHECRDVDSAGCVEHAEKAPGESCRTGLPTRVPGLTTTMRMAARPPNRLQRSVRCTLPVSRRSSVYAFQRQFDGSQPRSCTRGISDLSRSAIPIGSARIHQSSGSRHAKRESARGHDPGPGAP